MFTARKKGRLAVGAVAVGAALALAGCASGDPLDSGSGGDGGGDTIVVGSQQYPSNEIIASIYSQALQNAGFDVDEQFQIGQRDAYVPELENGNIDVFPEYTGNLLQYFDDTQAPTDADATYDALVEVLPDGLTALPYSPATDQDSYNVTAEFAEENGVTSIADLADIPDLVLGGAPELEERPYGPQGLLDAYGVTVAFQATGDTTVQALEAGEIDIANIYSADPSIGEFDFVTLEDPEGLFLPSNVVPIVSSDIADEVAEVLDPISEALTPEGLVELNLRLNAEQLNPSVLAEQWLEENGFLD